MRAKLLRDVSRDVINQHAKQCQSRNRIRGKNPDIAAFMRPGNRLCAAGGGRIPKGSILHVTSTDIVAWEARRGVSCCPEAALIPRILLRSLGCADGKITRRRASALSVGVFIAAVERGRRAMTRLFCSVLGVFHLDTSKFAFSSLQSQCIIRAVNTFYNS